MRAGTATQQLLQTEKARALVRSLGEYVQPCVDGLPESAGQRAAAGTGVGAGPGGAQPLAARSDATSLGPVHELAGVGGVGPDDGDLGVHESQAEEDFFGGVAVLEVGAGDQDQQWRAMVVCDDVPLPSVILSQRVDQYPDLR